MCVCIFQCRLHRVTEAGSHQRRSNAQIKYVEDDHFCSPVTFDRNEASGRIRTEMERLPRLEVPLLLRPGCTQLVGALQLLLLLRQLPLGNGKGKNVDIVAIPQALLIVNTLSGACVRSRRSQSRSCVLCLSDGTIGRDRAAAAAQDSCHFNRFEVHRPTRSHVQSSEQQQET